MFSSFLHIQLCVQPSLKIIVLISAPFDVFSINSSLETVASSFLSGLSALEETFSQNISSTLNHASPTYMTHVNKSTLHTNTCSSGSSYMA